MKNFKEYIARKTREYGDKFSQGALAEQFIPYYESGQRIEVEFVGQDGEVYETKRGTVGVTTGWIPVFILMARVNSTGSSDTLHQRDHVKRVIR